LDFYLSYAFSLSGGIILAELKLNGCTLTVLPANPSLTGRLRLKTKRKSFEWNCLKCGAKNNIKVNNLPYEFAGGHDWSQVMKSSAYITRLNKICMSKCDLVSVLAEKVKLEREYLGENFKLKLSTSTRIKEVCQKCGAKVTFNVELSSNKSSFLEKMESLAFEKLNIEITPEDNSDILNRLFRGFSIYLLMEKFSLAVNPEISDKMKTDRKRLKDLKRLLERIKSLRNDIDKTRLFDEIKVDIKKLTEAFQTDEALMYISDALLFIERIKDSIIKNFKRKLFLSLAQLEEQIKNLTLKTSF